MSSAIHVMPLFGPSSWIDLKSTMEKAWRVCFLATPMDWWGGTSVPHRAMPSAVGRPHQVAHGGPAMIQLPLVFDIWYFCKVFLHKQRSPSTNGTRSIININHYLCCCLLPFLVQCWWSKLIVKDHQQAPPHWTFARPKQSRKTKIHVQQGIKRYDANIKGIPSHTSYLEDFEVSTMSPWVVEKWNSFDTKSSLYPMEFFL